MAQVLVPTMAWFLAKQVEDHGAENVCVYGDSAGGTLGMLAVQHLVITGQTVPSRMVLISPGSHRSATRTCSSTTLCA